MVSDTTVRTAYSAINELYIDLFGSPTDLPPDDSAFVLRHLAGTDGPVLDLGCGPGHFTQTLHAAGLAATGIDLVPEFIAHAASRYPGIPFRVDSIRAIDAPTGSIGGLLAWFSLIHFTPGELPAVLAEFARVLAPGGRLVLGFFDTDEPVEVFAHKVTPAYRWPVDTMAAVLADAGFTEIDRFERPATDDMRRYAALATSRRQPEGGHG
ncbi:putative methyltransferase [Nocardia asteroides NBRC 15531]|uniref:Methyltransferase n=1 Tax=Nocardia asteroides NBRC 15531 TaxID=1110697 RepID=U5E4N4_NOCAS|nr:putative methyltransferase [Nocardia asteroides NBRC 15531]SFL94271.1 Ubiquinone/menaquinone biosynthesis C-methylase UbiE [Nocardia asteroides]VEG37810.1 Malonyl-CoA O-methyltransferase BioC [Nocardia asteroides]